MMSLKLKVLLSEKSFRFHGFYTFNRFKKASKIQYLGYKINYKKVFSLKMGVFTLD